MDVTSFSSLGGPHPQRGVGVVAPFDFALDRELWRWVPDEVSLHLTRTPYVPVEVSLDLARLVSEHETLAEAVRALTAAEPEVLAYACTSGSFVGGRAGERAMCEAMAREGAVASVTTSGALLEALDELDARRIALVTPYTWSVTQSLEEYLAEAGVSVVGRAYLGLTRHIWKVPYRDVADMARRAASGPVDALFISCTNLPTYDVIPQLEAELRMPVISANQVTMWSALRRLGTRAVGPYQALINAGARPGTAEFGALEALPTPAYEAVEAVDQAGYEVLEPSAGAVAGPAVTDAAVPPSPVPPAAAPADSLPDPPGPAGPGEATGPAGPTAEGGWT
ncbi:aspartate/glutamate racemase family protein [Streptomyces aurantiacus]|uniref:Putative Arylmalonate decarboxylase n=1 Tax=Streptomyces aurantiacus JA 4570 TaxID=1286094 RepID=S3ZCE2_9ACTN|nr:aspartate/glutamate racemase family protein [Streptomyces aurantiacus]EPH40294.1 putative Arylmalonate decarboxylase [Streptomyces aurantiacus JA 4570]